MMKLDEVPNASKCTRVLAVGLLSKSLLVYIPCNSDLESAIDQARSIRGKNERLLQSI